jgi:hypothetical protein
MGLSFQKGKDLCAMAGSPDAVTPRNDAITTASCRLAHGVLFSRVMKEDQYV